MTQFRIEVTPVGVDDCQRPNCSSTSHTNMPSINQDNILLLEGLEPNTQYQIRATPFNYYADSSHAFEFAVKTGDGVPGKPEEVMAVALAPKSALVSWKQPVLVPILLVRNIFCVFKAYFSILVEWGGACLRGAL